MNILITGGATGLGKELATQYWQQGHTVILTGRNEQNLKLAQAEIAPNGERIETYVLDIRQPLAVETVVEQIFLAHNIDTVINNAGLGIFGPLPQLTDDAIDTMIDTNVKGTIFVTRSVLPYFIADNKGTIINIISTAGLRSKVNESVYVASKFAVRGFTESLQVELADTNIHVAAVYMGGMNTPFWQESTHVADVNALRSPANVARYIIEHAAEKEIHVP